MRAAALAAVLALAACADETVSGYAHPGPWRLTQLDGQSVTRPVTLRFPVEGRVAGEMPCYRWEAQQTAPYPWFVLSHFRLDRQPCEDPEGDEAAVHALASVTLAEVQGRVLILSNEDGLEMVFDR